MNALDDILSRIAITGVTSDSRRVEPGFVFAALPGSRADGRAFIDDAIKRGAVAVIVPDDDAAPAGLAVPVVRAADPRRRYALLAAALAGPQPTAIGAVTGTNGKTSVAWFSRQLLNAAGYPSASAGTLGTLGTAPGGATVMASPGVLTTPDPADLHRELHDLKAAGVEHVVMEASSHGLDQRRLDGVRVRAAAFTNLSRDHLDYHGSEDAYLAAKLRLFDTLVVDGGRVAVNMDARFGDAFASAAQRRGLDITRVGSREDCHVRLVSVQPTPTGLAVDATIDGAAFHVDLPLVGAFQAANAMLALALVGALGVDIQAAMAGLSHLKAAPGRMQLCGRLASGAGVFVDYAHTPDALETVLKALRPHTQGRLHVVFGCGGDRDAGKRPLMGQAAAALADRVIVTDDNPRTENAAEIRRQVLAGVPGATEIGARRDAIRAAVAELKAGDVLVIAGKGHEQGQIVGTEVKPFDDVVEAVQAIAEVSR